MSTLKKGIFILALLVAGSGFGVGLAAADPMDNPSWTSQDQEAVAQYQDYLAGPDLSASGPVGTGAVTGPNDEDSRPVWISGYGEEKAESVQEPVLDW